jgi:3-(3-hydroxy-phenyl)propionate hydroxylase
VAETPKVIVAGAGPVGLTLANLLGGYGVPVLVVDERDRLIDYPRGVGIDDEALRTFQAAGVIDRVLPHTNPDQIMRFVNGKGQLLAAIAPTVQPFGWPRRSGFVQPLVDAGLLAGLGRFGHVEVRWGHRLDTLDAGPDSVAVTLASRDAGTQTLTADYVVGCDGGKSATRHFMGVSFDGTTSPTRWVVIDIQPDPLGRPNVDVGADPARPFVSVSIAHAIRRFEFMLHEHETDEAAEDPAFIHALMARFVPYPEKVTVLRHRVYTHHSRIAAAFRQGRVLLAGDAAHLMPVWQGQGYNSGIRDAMNLAWKLAAVARGEAGDALLDTYDAERRPHAQAMIDLSTMVGRVISPTSATIANARDILLRAANAVPALKRYVVEMRFKPMPRYERGAVVHARIPVPKDSPVGTLFIQPRVDTRDGAGLRLDDVLGPWFSVVAWNNNPKQILGPGQFARWNRRGASFVALRPQPQLAWPGDDDPDVVIAGDVTGRLKSWFDPRDESVLFLRPDRAVAAACVAQRAPETAAALATALSLS